MEVEEESRENTYISGCATDDGRARYRKEQEGETCGRRKGNDVVFRLGHVVLDVLDSYLGKRTSRNLDQ